VYAIKIKNIIHSTLGITAVTLYYDLFVVDFFIRGIPKQNVDTIYKYIRKT